MQPQTEQAIKKIKESESEREMMKEEEDGDRFGAA